MEKYDVLKMFHMLKHAFMPKETELEALLELYRLLRLWSRDSDALVIVSVYSAGKIIGKREERNRRRIRKGGGGK